MKCSESLFTPYGNHQQVIKLILEVSGFLFGLAYLSGEMIGLPSVYPLPPHPHFVPVVRTSLDPSPSHNLNDLNLNISLSSRIFD